MVLIVCSGAVQPKLSPPKGMPGSTETVVDEVIV